MPCYDPRGQESIDSDLNRLKELESLLCEAISIIRKSNIDFDSSVSADLLMFSLQHNRKDRKRIMEKIVNQDIETLKEIEKFLDGGENGIAELYRGL